MSKALKEHIEQLTKEAEEYADLKEGVLEMKTDIMVATLGTLMQKLDGAVDEFLVNQEKTEYFDKGLAGVIKDTITKLVQGLSELKPPQITVQPSTLDMSPLKAMFENIQAQNGLIIELQKLNGASGTNPELKKLIENQTAFLDKAFKQIDYSDGLSQLIQTLKAKPVVDKIVPRYWDDRTLRDISIEYKK